EVDAARQMLAAHRNPLALVTDTTAPWNREIALDDAAWRQIVDGLRERFTVLHFTFGPPPAKPMEDVVAMPAMSLRQTAALFFAIGKFVGVDGGEMQLMLAAGGRAIALSPPASTTYDPARWQYASERDWG